MNKYKQKFNISLSFAELLQLLHIAKDNKRTGEYYGNKEQYNKRANKIINTLENELISFEGMVE